MNVERTPLSLRIRMPFSWLFLSDFARLDTKLGKILSTRV